MNYFWVTVQIVAGILSPFYILGCLVILKNYLEKKTKEAELELEREKKRPPFDTDVTLFEVPNPTMVGLSLYKGSKLVWKGAVNKKGIII